MRVAGLDCGTNTIRLLVLDGDGTPLLRTSRIVRLGEGVDATGRLSGAALERTLGALDSYVALMDEHGVEEVRCCATSAGRDAANRDDLVAGVRARLGVEPEVLSGAQEAALTFGGAVGGLRVPVADPVLVLDIGGGSTELVLGSRRGGRPAVGHSADVGAVRLAERHLRTDPPTAAELAACAADVDAALDAAVAAGVDLASAGSVVGVAGTVLTLAAGLTGARDLEACDQAVLALGDVTGIVEELAGMTTAERVATGWVDPGRADVLPAGGVVLTRVLRRTGAESVVASVGDILDGIARSLLP